MKIMPIVSAILVAMALYIFIMQRDLIFPAKDTNTEHTETTASPDKSDDSISVVVKKSIAEPIESGVILRGTTAASKRVSVKSEASGLVISEPILKGTRVEKGQVLCLLDSGTSAAKLTEAEARLAEAVINNNATKALVKKGYATKTAAKSRLAALEAAQAAVKQAERQIQNLSVHAPFSGLLEEDTAQTGDLLQPGLPCGTILDLNPIKLIAYAAERELSKIEVGAPASGELLSGIKTRGKVTFKSRSADPKTRTFRIEVEVENPDLLIPDGATVTILVGISGQKAHLVPNSALTLNDRGEIGIRAAVDNTATFMSINILRDEGKGTWVTGLPNEVDIIIVGHEFVTDGKKITPTYQEDVQ